MGTWGDGLYDNDSALDTLGDIFDEVERALETSPQHFVAGLGLVAWMAPSRFTVYADRFAALLKKRHAWIADAPASARERLEALAQDVRTFTKGRCSRSNEVRSVLGSYCDGPREDSLLRAPGAEAVLEAFAESCRARLDAVSSDDLYEIAGELAPLGVLLELEEVGIRTPRDRVDRWRRAFEASNEATSEEREFFDEYVARVRKGFDLLVA